MHGVEALRHRRGIEMEHNGHVPVLQSKGVCWGAVYREIGGVDSSRKHWVTHVENEISRRSPSNNAATGCAAHMARHGSGRRRWCRTWRARLRTISPAGVQIENSAPDDHLAAGPGHGVKVSWSGRIGDAGDCPAIGAGIVSPAAIQLATVKSAPNDHLTASPNCGVHLSGSGRVGGAGGCPAISARIVSPTSVQIV